MLFLPSPSLSLPVPDPSFTLKKRDSWWGPASDSFAAQLLVSERLAAERGVVEAREVARLAMQREKECREAVTAAERR